MGGAPPAGTVLDTTLQQEPSRCVDFLRKLLHGQSGQGISEYLIIVALVAVAAIGVITVFGRDIRELFAGTTDQPRWRPGENNAARPR